MNLKMFPPRKQVQNGLSSLSELYASPEKDFRTNDLMEKNVENQDTKDAEKPKLLENTFQVNDKTTEPLAFANFNKQESVATSRCKIPVPLKKRLNLRCSASCGLAVVDKRSFKKRMADNLNLQHKQRVHGKTPQFENILKPPSKHLKKNSAPQGLNAKDIVHKRDSNIQHTALSNARKSCLNIRPLSAESTTKKGESTESAISSSQVGKEEHLLQSSAKCDSNQTLKADQIRTPQLCNHCNTICNAKHDIEATGSIGQASEKPTKIDVDSITCQLANLKFGQASPAVINENRDSKPDCLIGTDLAPGTMTEVNSNLSTQDTQTNVHNIPFNVERTPSFIDGRKNSMSDGRLSTLDAHSRKEVTQTFTRQNSPTENLASESHEDEPPIDKNRISASPERHTMEQVNTVLKSAEKPSNVPLSSTCCNPKESSLPQHPLTSENTNINVRKDGTSKGHSDEANRLPSTNSIPEPQIPSTPLEANKTHHSINGNENSASEDPQTQGVAENIGNSSHQQTFDLSASGLKIAPILDADETLILNTDSKEFKVKDDSLLVLLDTIRMEKANTKTKESTNVSLKEWRCSEFQRKFLEKYIY